MIAVLDAWAAIAFLQGEASAPRIKRALQDEAVMSDINVGEVLYTMARRRGGDVAARVVGDLRGIIRCEQPDWELTREAATLKAEHTMSYADAFAIATARRHAAPLYTGDPEIMALGDLVEVVDLR